MTGIRSEPLTEREIDVLQLLAGGKSNKEIATNLFISEFTVKGQSAQHFHQAKRFEPHGGHCSGLPARIDSALTPYTRPAPNSAFPLRFRPRN